MIHHNSTDGRTDTGNQWVAGQVVKVGFLRLEVVGPIQNCQYYGLPQAYLLKSLDGTRAYEFVPHNGLHRIK